MVMFQGPDHKGERQLGYRACGIINNDLSGLKFEEEPQVHDAERPVWTTMPSDQRLDIRKEIISKARKACDMMKKRGKNSFEYLVK
jgi:hypothetical protein